MNRDEFISASDSMSAQPPTPVKIRGFGTVHVRLPTVAEITRENKAIDPEATEEDAVCIAVARVLCDENGGRLFSATKETDMALLKTTIAGWGFGSIRKLLAASKALEEEDDSGN